MATHFFPELPPMNKCLFPLLSSTLHFFFDFSAVFLKKCSKIQKGAFFCICSQRKPRDFSPILAWSPGLCLAPQTQKFSGPFNFEVVPASPALPPAFRWGRWPRWRRWTASWRPDPLPGRRRGIAGGPVPGRGRAHSPFPAVLPRRAPDRHIGPLPGHRLLRRHRPHSATPPQNPPA